MGKAQLQIYLSVCCSVCFKHFKKKANTDTTLMMRLDDNLYLNILILLIVLLANGQYNYPGAVEVRQD